MLETAQAAMHKLGIGIVVVLVLGCGSAPPITPSPALPTTPERSGTSSPAGSAAPSTAVASPTAAASAPVAWAQLLVDQSPFAGSTVGGVTSLGDGYVAVGTDGDHPAAWTSADGRSWVRDESPPAPQAVTVMSGVVPGGPGLVAVGYQLGDFPTCTGMGPFVLVSTCNGPRDAVAWTSKDGRHWDLVPSPASFTGYLIDRPSTGSAGLIAPGHAAFGPMTTVIWATPDGLRWQRRSSSSFKDGGITGLAPMGSGWVAVGQGGFATHRFVARAWDSANGQVWSKANVEAGGDLMTGVATTAHGLVAVGETPAGGGIAWTSADGLSWKAATISHATALAVVAAVAGGVVAAGGDGIWELPDGQPWRHAVVVAGVTFVAIISSSARTLVIGTRGDQPLAEEVVAWQGPPDIAP